MIVTPEVLEIATHVLFGNQKQANVQNVAVASIVVEEVAKECGANSVSSESTFVTSVTEFLNRCATNAVTQSQYLACKLLVGVKAVDVLTSGQPVEIVAESAGDNTPKYYFFVHTKEEVKEVTHYVRACASADDTSEVIDDSIQGKVDAMRDKLITLVPDVIKAELNNNDYACALWATQYMQPETDVDAIRRQLLELVRRGGDVAANIDKYFQLYKTKNRNK